MPAVLTPYLFGFLFSFIQNAGALHDRATRRLRTSYFWKCYFIELDEPVGALTSATMTDRSIHKRLAYLVRHFVRIIFASASFVFRQSLPCCD